MSTVVNSLLGLGSFSSGSATSRCPRPLSSSVHSRGTGSATKSTCSALNTLSSSH
ncbi:hypothetical protein PF010_g23235 [Phytophthora fragariae]|uniref:Uncharacterized protein n=1 Tax=Phytophthora fragariae TaxID=53985 RepID=A0A6A3HWV1_9STRA|nr:hypothetical protein PF011_g24614 [Phytophthora fragariae]KAE9078156.1 hypothetical protein PF010_g23235 [Phytophthora fragariae]KAE9186109.1 hypothetical protein PF004_g23176 [Phytophthora fragariae]KAE9298983.1 hypothetical protein PF008_g23362 [Phytophthora fragariae]